MAKAIVPMILKTSQANPFTPYVNKSFHVAVDYILENIKVLFLYLEVFAKKASSYDLELSNILL